MLVGKGDLKVKLIDFGLAFNDGDAPIGTIMQPVSYRCLYPTWLLCCCTSFFLDLSGLTWWLLIHCSRLPPSGLLKYSSACPSATALTCGQLAASLCFFTSSIISSERPPPMGWWVRYLRDGLKKTPSSTWFLSAVCVLCLQMTQIVQLLGQPDDKLLSAGKFTKKYFVHLDASEGSAWRLKVGLSSCRN